MINWEKELERIFDDPLLADVVAPKKRTTSSDRLIAGFQEILNFYETNGRLPEDTESERTLFHKWKGLLKKDTSVQRCRPYDTIGILPQEPQELSEPEMSYHEEMTAEEKLNAIFNDPLLSNVLPGEDLGLFDMPEYMRQRLAARKEAEYVGKRSPCEDFDKYAEGFKEIQQGIKTGKYKLIKFSVKHLKVGNYFVEDGMIGYLAAFNDDGINLHGNRDGRTRVIYENGVESDIKYKTITKNLSVTGYSVIDCSEMSTEDFEKYFTLRDSDIESGTIYVLRSKSTRPEIAAIKDLYKIGFTATSIESRIANAKNEPTYLCADVEIVASWKVYNVKSSTFEALIHKLFASVLFQVNVDGHKPQEWFIVPFRIIEKAVLNIVKGVPMKYDPKLQQIIEI
ncbi:MAG: GIY-YIG nuclease family protein [Bacteroides sp.]|nr:GIY-YIG nuclease family protein [Bacteroides sp.]MCM1456414.1 GIY-YIG nuclease family protein [Lachnoclostridium sp.]